MPFTKEVRAEQLDAIDGGSNSRRLALFVGSPVGDGVEVTGSGYARVNVTMEAADDSVAPVDKVSVGAATWTATANGWPSNVDFLASYADDNTTLIGYMSLGAEYDMSLSGAVLTIPAGDYIERQP